MKRSEPYVVVSRVGTLASYLWVPSEPMEYEAARDLATQQERRGVAAVVHPAKHVADFGLPEGWEAGKTDAQCIRERLLDIESEMEQEAEAHNESESTEEWPTVRFQHLDNEQRALRRRLAELARQAKEAA